MKRAFARLSGSLMSGLATGVIIGLAVLLPAVTSAADTVKLAGSMGVVNIADGGSYAGTVKATTNQVVKLQVYYVNQEDAAADSSKTAGDTRVKVTMPSQAGRTQTVSSSVKATNSNDVSGRAVVTLDRDDASLQYIPGSAMWKHNTGNRQAPKIEETKLSDDVVLNGQGVSLGDVIPGDAFAGTVTVQARVLPTSSKLTMESQKKSDTDKWSSNNSANPGDTMRYIISYQNTGNGDQNGLVLRGQLPDKVQLVAGSAKLYSSANKDGVSIADDITKGGVTVGTYGPGANAYVTFEAALPAADALACGSNTLRAIGSAKAAGGGEYLTTTVTTVRRDCAATPPAPTPTQPTPQPQPAYSCDALTLTKGDARKLSAKLDYTAKDGASFKSVTYDFGDGSQPLVTDKTTVDHTYAKDGDYTVSAKLTVSAGGKDQVVTSAACSKPISFAAAATPPAAPSAAVGKSDLPNSGPGDVIGLFAAATAVGFAFHRLVLGRAVRR